MWKQMLPMKAHCGKSCIDGTARSTGENRVRLRGGSPYPDVVGMCDLLGILRLFAAEYSVGMQLIQIGAPRQKTVLDLVMEMAERQFAEIEQLKTTARTRAGRTRSRRTHQHCTSSKATSTVAL